ncbi:hypothetical protein [Pseudonocardia sp. ICBG601]|nr:hypothetical protein [Pseudonocardia sp. ICBG601]
MIRENDTVYAHWRFGTDADAVGVRVTGAMTCNDGESRRRGAGPGAGW